MARRLHTLFLGHLGMHDLALGGGVERGAAVVAVLEREVVLKNFVEKRRTPLTSRALPKNDLRNSLR